MKLLLSWEIVMVMINWQQNIASSNSVWGDEFPRRLCDPLLSVTAVLYYRWLPTGLRDKTISQGVGGHRVRHPSVCDHTGD